MPKTIIKVNTWTCSDCGYHQDFDPNDGNKMVVIFPGVEVGHCPACFLGKNPEREVKRVKMVVETDPKNKTTVTVMGEEEVDTLEVETEELDVKGESIMRKLTAEEKVAKIQKIRADIKKFRALEDK